MKHLITAAICGTAFALSLPTAQAQGPGHSGGPHKKGPPPWIEAKLSPDEAQRLAAAREKVKDDPTIKSLRESHKALNDQLEKAFDAAIVAADPGLAPVLEKIKQARTEAKGMRDRFDSLTPDQREKLKAAREAAKSDPAVAAAREKMQAAQTPEAKREARRAMHEAMQAAMVKQNPDLAPLIEKIRPKHDGPDGPPPGGAPGGE
ncbi:MAG: hypothetical protein FGM15_00095 [Chthoniobacterales bacterium]|nr:hypothetical protein [Chthoniobacterales bacterium]